MSSYLIWNQKNITDFSDTNINSLYNEGYLFARTGYGDMYQTRSLRIDLDRFKLTSENKRILRKIEDLRLQIAELPYENYDWTIAKLGKDFYETKFGEGTFSANKIKELLTTAHNFNKLFNYSLNNSEITNLQSEIIGYAICFENKEILHYCYPFYNLKSEINNLGLGMMLRAINYAKESGKKYIYLGSVKDEAGKYKLQFAGLEWFDGNVWQQNLEKLKRIFKEL